MCVCVLEHRNPERAFPETISRRLHIGTARQRSALLLVGVGESVRGQGVEIDTLLRWIKQRAEFDSLEMVSPGSRCCPLEFTPGSADPYLNIEGRLKCPTRSKKLSVEYQN